MSIGGSSGCIKLKSIEITYLDDPEPTEPTLTFGDYNNATIEKHVGDDNFIITASLKPSVEDAKITYYSSNESVAIVGENTGEVVIGDEGTSVITAKYVDASTSAEQTASYTLNVTKVPTTLSFGETYDNKTIIKYVGDDIFTTTATLSPTIEGATIKYSSTNENVAVIDETGSIILGDAVGETIIKAEYAGDSKYASATVSYTLQLKEPVAVEDGVFDFTSGELDYGSGLKPSTSTTYLENTQWKNGIITITTSGNTRWWKADNNELRFYSGSKFTLSVPEGNHITDVVITGAYSFKADCGTYNANSGKWNGDAKTITFSYNAKSGAIAVKTITVTYVPDVTLTTAASSFATYAADYAVDYSAAGLDAYAVILNENEGTVGYNAITGTTPAGTAVLVKGDASTTYSLAPSTDKEATVTTALQISDGNVTATDNLYYGFATLNGVSGFKLVQNGVAIPAKKGYLKLSSSDNAKTFYAFDGNTTGIEETFSKNEAEKALAPMYNISGQRVGEGYKGIVIVNGKKYMK